MKRALFLIYAAWSTTQLFATTPTLTTITQPLYFLGSAGDAKVQYIKTPKILNNSSAMFWITLFSSPTETQDSGGDLNLLSMYGVSVEMTAQDPDGHVTEITIKTDKAERPQNYPFTIEEVAKMAVRAVRIEFTDENLTKIVVTNNQTATDGNKKANKTQMATPRKPSD